VSKLGGQIIYRACKYFIRRSQWPRGHRHEMPSPAWTLGFWVRIPLNAWMFICVYSVFLLSCAGSGLATGWSLVQGVLQIVYKCKIKEPHKRRPRPDMDWSAIEEEEENVLHSFTLSVRRYTLAAQSHAQGTWTVNTDSTFAASLSRTASAEIVSTRKTGTARWGAKCESFMKVKSSHSRWQSLWYFFLGACMVAIIF
jgi:hypothetical protein